MPTESKLNADFSSAFDVVIVGGGLVGACLAIALEKLPLRVAMLEAQSGGAMPAVFDQRNLSFNEATLNALTHLGVLPLLSRPSGDISSIETSRVGDFGRVWLRAAEYGRAYFGQVVVASDFGEALERRLSSVTNLTRLRPAKFVSSRLENDSRIVVYSDETGAEHSLTCSLLVGADGAASSVRSSLGIAADSFDYGHSLFVCRLQMRKPPAGIAYERLSSQGPIAVLPRGDGHFGLVLGVRSDDVARVRSLSDAEYVAYAQDRFGYRAGEFVSVGERSVYPGMRVVASSVVADRAVLVGNAAQSLHPVGAQGFNLGLRDAMTLAELIEDDVDALGSASMLSTYVARRSADRERTMQMSHSMATIGTAKDMASRVLRELAMVGAGHVKSVQARLVGGSMGYAGDVPRNCRSAS